MWPRNKKSPEILDTSPDRDVIKSATGALALGAVFDKPRLPEVGIDLFDTLRTSTYQKMRDEISARLALDPVPTTEERLMGTYVEALEPQVRSATMAMRAKGYNTTASGFHGTDDDWRVMGIDNPLLTYSEDNRRGQTMDFREPLTLSPETLNALREVGAEMPQYPGLEGQVVRIGFMPSSPDLALIEAQWNAVAGVLPDLGMPAGPRMGSLESTNFGVYCPPDIAWPTESFNSIAAQAVADTGLSWGAESGGGMSTDVGGMSVDGGE